MSVQKTPRIIFVDGFNTVGKDHFITELNKRLPKPVINSDPRVWLPVFQKSQRYWDFIFRNLDQNDSIFNAHLHQLRSIEEKLNDGFTSDMVVVSNRSFITALNYNFIPEWFLERRIGGCDDTRASYLQTYKELIKKVFKDVPILMVNLDRFHGDKADLTLVQCVHELRARMHARQPDLLMNDFYLEYLIQSYKLPSQEIKDIYTYWEDATSDDAQLIVDKYFN